ncbi:cytochrome P450 [Colletotrichum karsti]|uniref:Cytochrome P450 n=1 Tax=Colletotrichum karsti TaxID=1095194 RepID=A0A9P6IAF4_9PEZI|nr:cytochrome P450 [Colletotrichum karsti]KAF9878737.1 cytochrome P450 [Colletotrichum karsti]
METQNFSHLATSSAGRGLEIMAIAMAMAAGVYVLYRHLLPKPIPGVPYNPEAVTSILGDLPGLIRENQTGGSGLEWMIAQAKRHPGPLCQIFIQPLGKSFLVLADFCEAQDIFLRRAGEWDRSDWSIEILGGAVPSHHINMKTGPEWKAHRRLLQDLMTPSFLHTVAAPNIYRSVCNLVELWDFKSRESNGRPFTALDDIYDAAMDAVLEFSFGSAFPHRAIHPQLEAARNADLKALRGLLKAVGEDEPVEFPRAAAHETIQATYQTSKAIGEVYDFPRPRFGWYLKKFQPSETAAARVRHAYIKDQIDKGVERLLGRSKNGSDEDEWIKSAVDLMLSRETKFAAKEGRDPIYWSSTMRDEVLGFVIAGHDTTSTTILWGLKFLTASPEVQDKLRAALRAVHAGAVEESRAPSPYEITHNTVAYLDAVVEEILRLAGTIPVIERQCNRDTTLLGRFVPKGTTVLFLGVGPTITEVGQPVDDKLRSESSQKSVRERGVRGWNPEDIGEFRPERWLTSIDGEDVFDGTAGPTLPFGNGLRGCFGRRLAYVEMKIIFTMLVWHFELLQTPEKLSGNVAVDELTPSFALGNFLYISLASPQARYISPPAAATAET